jgi:hypothetical protein
MVEDGMMARKLTHKTRASDMLQSLGWTVADVEKHLRHTFVTQDLFGFADLLAFDDELTLLLQVTSPPNVSARVEKCLDEPRLRNWLAQKTRIAEVWGVRDKPARDGSMVLVRCFELTAGGELVACDGSDVLPLERI